MQAKTPVKKREYKKITHPKQVNLRNTESILVVMPENIEDFILSTPAVSALKESMGENGKITAVVAEPVKKIARSTEAIDKIIISKTMNPFAKIRGMAGIMAGKFDVLVNFNPEFLSSVIISFLSGARARVAYALKKESKIYNKFHNLMLHTLDEPQHKIVKYLNLVRFIGANSYDFTPKIKIPDKDMEFARAFMKKCGVADTDHIVGIHATLKDVKKRWSLNKFEQLTKNLVDKYGVKVFVFYHANEKSRLNEFMHVIRNKATAVETHDYLKLAAVSNFFSCFVCNETDFMHVLSPFTNMIVIWGDSDPDINKPGGHNNEVMQASDGNADSVPVSRVTEHIKKYISNSQ